MAGIFTQIRPVWIGKLEIQPKKKFKKLMVGALYFNFFQRYFILAMSFTAIKFFFVYLHQKIKLFYFAPIYKKEQNKQKNQRYIILYPTVETADQKHKRPNRKKRDK